MEVYTSLRAAGQTHPGLQREQNEDRFHCDPERGLFLVVDGVGGQAAGERAAELALRTIRTRLEGGSGPLESRIRQAITRANNEIFHDASRRAEWKGMACVLTVVVLDGLDAVVGHVGDTRLYKIRGRRIEKLTHDHSPVGEREDSGDLSEAEAMRHPRRNEVYRDVGSERHDVADPDFIDTFRVPFESDAALLLCSDGLTDLVEAGRIRQIVEEHAGHPELVAGALIDAANDAGGKDNITVVYVEGARFAEGEDTGAVRRRRAPRAVDVDLDEEVSSPPVRRGGRLRVWRILAIIVLLAGVSGWALYQRGDLRFPLPAPAGFTTSEPRIVVRAGESITAAIARAQAGAEVVVEPGEYRERLLLKTGVRVWSRVPRAAVLRLPSAASEQDAAIVAEDVSDAEVHGFRVLGDAATPLGTGVFVQRSNVVLTDLEISGARLSAVVFGDGAVGALLGSLVHDNAGSAVVVRTGAEPRIAHNTFARNAASERSSGPILVEAEARPEIRQNVFVGVAPEGILGGAPASFAAENWFVPASSTPSAPGGSGGRRGSR